MSPYVPAAIFLLISVVVAIFLLCLGTFLGGSKPSEAKQSSYECGFPPISSARMPFDIRFYLVAILFIVFDLETAFLFPWAVVFRAIGMYGFLSMLAFLSILVIGFVYEWQKGALEWE